MSKKDWRWMGPGAAEFRPESNVSWSIGEVGTVWVRGPAWFEKGTGEARFDWSLKQDRPSLNNILLHVGGEEVSIPGFTGEIRHSKPVRSLLDLLSEELLQLYRLDGRDRRKLVAFAEFL
ncbi:MAG: hypothetical protein JO185_18085 [Acidobacteriaceae bacterium]|nr:hypothetical protein [Acidobacteriaceae bacterium]MBV9678251.1 hypothetical protein [Acidobacteriaceae bacterium]